MFGKKRKAYEEEIDRLRSVINDYNNEKYELMCDIRTLTANINELEKALLRFTELEDATPEDCKRGEWCKACEFAVCRLVRVQHPNFATRYHTVYMCGKGESCQHFVQRKEE